MSDRGHAGTGGPQPITTLIEAARSFQDRATRLARQMRDRLPPVVIEHKIDALERHMDRRFKQLEERLDEIARQLRARAA